MAIVDGTYQVTTERPDIAFWVRVDLTRHTSFRQVSGDLVQRVGGIDTVRGSFFATDITEATDIRLSAPLEYYDTGATATLTFEVVTLGDGTESLVGTYTPTSPGQPVLAPLRLTPKHLFDSFRQVNYEIDYDQATVPPTQVSYQFAGTSQVAARTVTVEECWTFAGLSVQATAVNAVASLGGAYTIDDVQRNMDAHFLAQPASTRPAVYLYIATALKDATTLQIDPNTLGMMFDTNNRRGATVFYQTIKNRTQGGTVPFEAEYIRTTVHELGHTFNLPHAFEDNDIFKNRSASATFMNYPQNYTAGAGPADAESLRAFRYWNDFQYQFDQAELLSLAHGPFHRVLMGAGQDKYLGKTSGDGGSDFTADRGQAPGGLQLKLRLKPDRSPANILEFGEPVHVELKLTNRSFDERVVHDVLEPHYEFTRFLIRRPDGRLVEFQLPYSLSVDAAGAAEVLSPERPSLYATTCLSYGKDGFYFLDPGQYQIQAVHLTPTGVVTSNILKVWVRHPIPEQEELFVPTFTDEVAMYFLVGGSPLRPKALDTLNEFTEEAGLSTPEEGASKPSRDAVAPAGTPEEGASKPSKPRMTALRKAAFPLVSTFKAWQAFADARGAVALDPKTRTLTKTDPKINHDQVRDAAGFDLGMTKVVAEPAIGNILFGALVGLLIKGLEPADRDRVGKAALNYLNNQKTGGRSPRKTPLPEWVANEYRQRWDIA